jgi:hypothetical protein
VVTVGPYIGRMNPHSNLIPEPTTVADYQLYVYIRVDIISGYWSKILDPGYLSVDWFRAPHPAYLSMDWFRGVEGL